jgi:hypothetical protein
MTTTAKIKKWFDFDWLKKTELVELHEVDCTKDPVRPELDIKFRTSYGRKIYGLKHGKDIMAVMCFAFTNQVPKTVEEMDALSKDAAMQAVHRAGVQGSIAIAYTVWSLKKGGGKMIVKEVYNMIKQSNHLNRLVTLSPLTKMAEKFHLRNGARLIQKNESTQNFEYVVLK